MQDYNRDHYAQEPVIDQVQGLNIYIAKVFGLMFFGLIITALTSLSMLFFPSIFNTIVQNNFLFFGLIIGEFALVIFLSRRFMKMSYQATLSSYILYSVLNGLTLSIILFAYSMSSVVLTFGITAVTFGVMAVYGRVTKTDLTQFRSLLFMGLIGVIILSLINMFIGSSGLEWFITILGLFIFLGLTAYDTQKLKEYYAVSGTDAVLGRKLAVMGALKLYLDFINLFLFLLRLFGRRR